MRPFTLVGSLLVTAGLAAQSYIPLLRPLAAWEDDNQCGSMSNDTYATECMRYSLAGDSVMNDTSYSILRRTGRIMHGYVYTPEQNYTTWYYGQFVALLREDTIERRVYIRRSGWLADQLFYDFSAGVGFYPPTYRFDDVADTGVTSVDTVWLSDGPHRRINFYDGYYAIIEGVGCTWGFMKNDLWGEVCWPGQLDCHTVGDSVNYNVSAYHCGCTATVGVSLSSATRLHLGPSPTTDLCYLFESPSNAPFVIRSMDGRDLRYGTCSRNGTTTIDLSDLPAAIYLLEVFDANGSLKARIVKE